MNCHRQSNHALCRPASVAGRLADLKVRLASGAVLVLVALGALAGGPYAFGAVVTIVAALMSWEWGRVVRSVEPDAPMVVHVTAVVLAGVLTIFHARPWV